MATADLHKFLMNRKSHLDEWSLVKLCPDACKYLVFQYECEDAPSLLVSDLVISHKDDGFWGYVQNGAWNGLFRNDRVIIPRHNAPIISKWRTQSNSPFYDDQIVPGKILWIGNSYDHARRVLGG